MQTGPLSDEAFWREGKNLPELKVKIPLSQKKKMTGSQSIGEEGWKGKTQKERKSNKRLNMRKESRMLEC